MQNTDQAGDLVLFQAISEPELKDVVKYSRSFDQLTKIDGVNMNIISRIGSALIERIINIAYSLNNPVTQSRAFMMNEYFMRHLDLSFEDLAIMLREGTSGQLGKIYGRFDIDTIMEWVDKYIDIRLDEIERQYNESKQIIGSPVRDSRVLEMTDKMIRKDNRPPDEKMFEVK